MFARSYCVFIATIMTAGIKLQYAPFTLKKKFVKADYHLPKVVPAEDAFFSIFHSLGQLLSFFHSFFPFYCFFFVCFAAHPNFSLPVSLSFSPQTLLSLSKKKKEKHTKIPTHGIIFLLKDKNKRRDKFRFFFYSCVTFWALRHSVFDTLFWHIWHGRRSYRDDMQAVIVGMYEQQKDNLNTKIQDM